MSICSKMCTSSR